MESRPSMLPFEGGEVMGNDEQEKEDVTPANPTHDMTRSSFPSSSSSNFTFSKDHYDLLNGWINSLTSTIYGLQHSVDGLTSMLQQVLASQQALHSRFDMAFPPHPPPDH
ncbi:hypothetical protein Adt_03550 [Abeliophyllum distichum]|uniref:Uncharacterized protein n=1 Tax=Abeliophyllum distichum TaxID=126358 RepID=A0ABD1VZ37_9LAMI